jgi:16S rRNA C967 or C1407 C5-methylase (RsmB/RsmF family)
LQAVSIRAKDSSVSRPLSNAAHRLAQRLFPGDEAERFLAALANPQRGGHSLAWLADRQPVPFTVLPACSWQPDWVDRVDGDSGAGRHNLHDQGAYYCMDASSIFAAQVLRAVESRPRLLIDLCAAPGGKSILAWRMLQPAHLLANEVVGKRLPPLLQNLKRCGIHPASVCSLEPAELGRQLPQLADAVLVDAPCSGQSLIARGKDAPGCFHPSIVNMNAQRQRRILAAAVDLVAPGGYLAYITCTYAEKENEANAAWLLKKFPSFTAVAVPALASHASHLTPIPCYRLWPQNGEGAGSFAVLFRREGSTGEVEFDAAVASLPNVRRVGEIS